MKIFIKEIKGDILQITTTDERWYSKTLPDGKQIFVPSVTWIASHYPKGVGFYKWLADKGWDEAEAIKEAAGDKGSKVHQGICDLIDGKTIKIDSKFTNNDTGVSEELKPEEYECLMSFVDWFNKTKPEIVDREFNIFNEELNYAGTVDLLCRIEGKLTIVDFKTSKGVWMEHKLQISAYRKALEKKYPQEPIDMALLQVGYKLNKNKYKYNEIEDKFDLFLAAQRIWAEECSNVKPLQKDYPLELKVNK